HLAGVVALEILNKGQALLVVELAPDLRREIVHGRVAGKVTLSAKVEAAEIRPLRVVPAKEVDRRVEAGREGLDEAGALEAATGVQINVAVLVDLDITVLWAEAAFPYHSFDYVDYAREGLTIHGEGIRAVNVESRRVAGRREEPLGFGQIVLK